MLERGRGAIVNIGSANAVIGMAGSARYAATKASVHSLTKNWAAELGPSGIRVNTVAPGPTLTNGNEAVAEYLEAVVANIPSRRLSTTAEVAAAVALLASDDASNIHGSTLSVDGGFIVV
jgi:NAD(P)-dependent dehydrogenase (short-subunit alcohol dehydrogenase family)